MYPSARESNQGVPSRFRKLDRKSHELYLIDRKLVSQRSKADIQPLWLNHMRFRETECIPEGYFLRHLPLAFGHNAINPGGLGAEPPRCPPLSVRSITKLNLTTVYATYAGPKQFGQTKAVGLSELFSPIVGSEDILDCAICVAFTFAIAE